MPNNEKPKKISREEKLQAERTKSLELLSRVQKLSDQNFTQKEIAKELGFKTTLTLNNRLVKASQITGKSVPPYRPERGARRGGKRVEVVQVKRRGKGTAFGVNVPQEPLLRAGYQPGDKLKVVVRGKSIHLTRQ